MARNTAVRSYMKNLGKSILYTSQAVMGEAMPSLNMTITQNSQVIKTGMTYTKDFLIKKGEISGKSTGLLSHIMRDIEEMKNNAFESLRTGDLARLDKLNDAMDEQFQFGDFDIDWGMGDSDPFADGEGPELDSSVEASIGAIRSAAKANHIGSNIRTKAIMDTVMKTSEQSANYLAKTNTKLQSLSMNMHAQMHTEVVKLMGNTNTLLTSIVNFNNDQVVDHMNKQLSFFDNVLGELREIKEAVKKPETTSRSSKSSAIEEIFGTGGFDLKAYAKEVKKNFANKFSGISSMGSMLASTASMSGMSIKEQIKQRPFGLAIDLIGAGLLPKSVRDGMNKLDQSFSGLLSAIALKMNAAKGDLSKPVGSFLASLFGIDVSQKTQLDVGSFHKGAVSYNGRADKAITEVIPHLLSNILSTLRGSDKVAVFDYTTGKFKHSAEIIKDHQERMSSSKRSGMYDAREHMRRSLSTLPGGRSAAMNKDLDTFLEYLVDSNEFYNPLKNTSAERMKQKGLNLSDPRVYNALRAAFLSMPKHMQNSMAKNILGGRSSASSTARTIESQFAEDGLGIVYSDLNKVHGPNAKKVQMTPAVGLLKDIKQILIDGIIVYGGGTISSSPSSSARDALNRRSKHRLELANERLANNNSGGSGGPSHNRDEIDQMASMPLEAMRTVMAAFNDEEGNRQGNIRNGFLRRLMNERSFVRRVNMVRQQFGSPGQIIAGMLGKMDTMIYRIIYGKEDTGADGEDGSNGRQPKGLIGRMAKAMNRAMDSAITFMDNKILTPIHEKFFGEKGLFTKFMESFDPFLDKMKEMANTGYKKFAKYMMGDKNAEGFYTGGALSDIGNMFVDFGNSTRNLLTGGGYTKSDGTKVDANQNSVFSYLKQYSKALFENIKVGMFGEKKEIMKEDGTIVLEHDGTGLFSGVMNSLKSMSTSFSSLFQTKEGETEGDVKKTINKWKGEMKGFLPKGLAGGLAGVLASAVLPGGPVLGAMLGSTLAFASHSSQFREYLFGNEETGKEGKIPKKYIDGFKKFFPSMSAGGILGMASSVVLPGGPLLGLALGSTIGYAAKSEKAQEFLFGKTDKDGKVLKDGLFGPNGKATLKKYFPNMGAGALLGLAGSLVLPGGPLIGMMMGSAAGFVSKSDQVKEMLFGKTDKDGKETKKGLISAQMQAKIKKSLPAGVAGSLLGALSGTVGFLTPAGPLMGAVIGATLSIAGTSEKFKDLMFGKTDPETLKRKGGALGQVRDFLNKEIFDPFKEWRKKKKVAIADWFQESIRKPFDAALEPFKQSMRIVGDRFKKSFGELKDAFKGAFNRVFEKSVGAPLGELVKKYLTGPMKNILNKMFNALGKALAAVATSPITFMTKFANSVMASEDKRKEKDERDSNRVSLTDRFKELGKFFTRGKANADGEIEADKKRQRQGGNPGSRVLSNLGNSLRSLFGRMTVDLSTGTVKVEPEKGSGAPKTTNGSGKITREGVPSSSGGGGRITSLVPGGGSDYGPQLPANNPINQVIQGQPKPSGSSGESNQGATGSVDYENVTLSGSLDLGKFSGHINAIDKNIAKIKDEISGQLNGVGWNLQFIANILKDTFGPPTDMPEDIERKGNRRPRGIMGRLMAALKSPTKFVMNFVKEVVTTPFKLVSTVITNTFKTFNTVLSKSIGPLLRFPFTVVRHTAKAIGAVANFATGIVKSVSPAIKHTINIIGTTIHSIFKGAGSILSGAAKGLGQILVGVGTAVKDSTVTLFKIAKNTLPQLGNLLGAAVNGLTQIVTGLGRLAKNMVVGAFKGIVGLGKGTMRAVRGLTPGGTIQQVFVAGGVLDGVKTIDTIKEVHTVERLITIGPSPSSPGSLVRGAARRIMSHASGLDAVPYDNYRANLHRGEMVLPSSQANVLRQAMGLPPVIGSTARGLLGSNNRLVNSFGETANAKSGIFSRVKRIAAGVKKFTSGFLRPLMPRIDYMANNVQRMRTDEDFQVANMGILNEIAVSNFQILNALTGNAKKSLWDLLKDLLGSLMGLLDPMKFLKNLLSGMSRLFPSLSCPCPTGGGGGGGSSSTGQTVNVPVSVPSSNSSGNSTSTGTSNGGGGKITLPGTGTTIPIFIPGRKKTTTPTRTTPSTPTTIPLPTRTTPWKPTTIPFPTETPLTPAATTSSNVSALMRRNKVATTARGARLVTAPKLVVGLDGTPKMVMETLTTTDNLRTGNVISFPTSTSVSSSSSYGGYGGPSGGNVVSFPGAVAEDVSTSGESFWSRLKGTASNLYQSAKGGASNLKSTSGTAMLKANAYGVTKAYQLGDAVTNWFSGAKGYISTKNAQLGEAISSGASKFVSSTGKVGSAVSKVSPWFGKIGSAAGLAMPVMAGIQTGLAPKNQQTKLKLVNTGAIAGTLGGASAGAALGGVLGVETGPGALITAAIGAIVGGVVGKKGVEKIYDKLTGGIDWKGIGDNAKQGFNDYLMAPAAKAWKATESTVSEGISKFKKSTKTIWDTINSSGKTGFAGVKENISNAITNLTAGTKEVLSKVTSFASSVGDTLKNAASSAWSTVKSKVSSIANSVGNTVSSAWDKTTSTAKTVVSAATSAAKTTANAVSSTYNKVKSGTNKVADKIESGVKNAAATVKEKFLDFFGSGGGKGGEPVTVNASNASSAALISNVPHVSQVSPTVKNLRFGKTSDTLGDSGCAPAVAAMAVSSITGKNVSISEMAKVAADNGFKTGFNGTNPLFFKYLEKSYPVSVTNITGTNMTKKIVTALRAGHLVILMGGGQDIASKQAASAYRKTTPFGSMPHYVLATGYDEARNKIVVNDPLSKSGSDVYQLTATLGSTTGAFIIQSRSKFASKFSLTDLANFLPGMSFTLGKGDDTDEGIRKEFGYALNYSGSDMTVDDIRMIKKLGAQYGVNPHLWLALVELESGFNSQAQSSKSSAKGWGQVLRSTGEWLYEDKLHLGNNYNHNTMALNKEINARMSMYYLASNIKSHKGNIAKALIRYNGNELGQAYPDKVANYLKQNAGLSFADVGNVNATGVNTYSGTSSVDSAVDTSKINSLSSLMTGITDMYTGALKDRFGIDYNTLSTGISDVFNLLDPFSDGSSSSSSSSIDSIVSSITGSSSSSGFTSSSTDESARDTEYKSYIQNMYSNLTGDTDVHQFFAERLSKLAAAYGKSVSVTSGYRSAAEQQQLINQWRKNNPGASEAERRKWVADPGTSKHDLGLAADLSGWIKQVPAATLAKYGIWKPLSNEDWHFEPIETKLYGRSNQDYLRQIFGNPLSPATGYEQYVQGGYGKGGIAGKRDLTNGGYEIPTPGNGIGDPDGQLTGAPSAASYASAAQSAASALSSKSSSSTTFTAEVINLLKIIAKGVSSLVDLTEEQKTILTAISKGTVVKTSTTSATKPIIQPSSRSANPFTDSTTRSGGKAKTISAIAAGTFN